MWTEDMSRTDVWQKVSVLTKVLLTKPTIFLAMMRLKQALAKDASEERSR